MLEQDLQKLIRVELSKLGSVNFRNNVGVLKDARGVPVRFGLGVGTSDLIGWTSVIVTPEMVGKPIAVFTAIETKRPKGGRATQEQINFISRLKASGGIAGFARSIEDVRELFKSWGLG